MSTSTATVQPSATGRGIADSLGTMQAAVVEDFTQPLLIKEQPVPMPGPGQVLVKIETSGLCHTDIHAAKGHWPVKPKPPFIPGHEGVGIVTVVGPGVTNVKEGDRVGLPWLGFACGECEYCATGWETLCERQLNTGYSIDGSYAQYAVAFAKYLGKVPDGLDPLDAAALTCAGVTTYKAVKVSEARPSDLVAVFGIGGLGHLAMQYARAAVVAVDLTEEKLALAKELGADYTINGRAKTPVYAYVHDGQVELLDASAVWGLGVHATVKHFQQQYGEKDLSVIAIGPAGENQVRFGAWINEMDRASGRGGTGAVGGSKQLKAVVIKSERKTPQPLDPEAFRAARKQALATIMDKGNITSPKKGGLSVYGTNVLMNVTSAMGALPTRNSQLTSFGERAERISGEYVKEHVLVHDPTCHACPVACKKEVEIKSGPYAGLRMESVEYEPAWSIGANCLIDDIGTVAKVIDQCNDLGMDAIEIGHCFSILMEATEQGYVNNEQGLNWGDAPGVVVLAEQIARRQGIGDLLAEGPARAAARLQHPELAMTVKGQAVPAYDPRGIKGMGLAYATSNRSACHLRAYTPGSELGLISFKTDPLAWEGKGELVKLFQDIHAFSDSLDLCKFSAFAEGVEEYAAQYAAMTGIPCTGEDVVKTGERIYNLERYYNGAIAPWLRCGLANRKRLTQNYAAHPQG